MRRTTNSLKKIFAAAALAVWLAPGANAQYTGNFSDPAGANFNAGDQDGGWDAAFHNDNAYIVGLSSPAGGLIIRYDSGGTMVSSATLPGVRFNGVAANSNGVYAVGTNATRMFIAKYDPSLVLVSSRIVEGSGYQGFSADIALSDAGNAFVAGTANNEYLIAMYNSDLALQGENGFGGGTSDGPDTASGVAVDGTNVYLAGHSLISGATYFVLARFDETEYLSSYSSVTFAGVYMDAAYPLGGKLAVNPVSHDIYAAVNSAHTSMLLLRYDQTLSTQAMQTVVSTSYAQASDVTLDATGYVYLSGAYYDDAVGHDYPLLVKYGPDLVLLSSAASVQPYGYEATGLAVDTVTGYGYVTGVYFSDGSGSPETWDIRTVRLGPLGGSSVYGVITGTLSYEGSQEGTVVVAIFTNADIMNSEPYDFATANTGVTPWDYTTPSLPLGTYYLAAIMATEGMEDIQGNDPWDVLGSTDNPTPVVLTENALYTGNDFTLVDGTIEAPNPFFDGGYIRGDVTYTGTIPGTLLVAVSSLPLTAGSPDNIIEVHSVSLSSFTFVGLQVPGTYYLTAWVDASPGNNTVDCGEPNGAYQPERGGNCIFESRPIYLAANTALSGADIRVLDFALVSGTVSNNTGQDGNGVFMATQAAAGYVPFYMETVIAGAATPYEFSISTSADPYNMTVFIDSDTSGTRGFFEPYGTTGNIAVLSTDPVSGADIEVTTPTIPVPSLDWAGGISYPDTGVPNGYAGMFVYRVKYTSPNGLAPKNGYPKVNIANNGVPLTGSPFTMAQLSPEDVIYTDGKVYTYTIALSSGSAHSYQFEAYDSDDIPSGGPAGSLQTNSPEVYELPVITYSTATHSLSGITAQVFRNGMFGAQHLARDLAGNIYTAQTDTGRLVLTKRDGAGVSRTTFVDFGGGTLADLVLDAAGNSYILGGSDGALLVAKFSTLGEELWVSTFGYVVDPVSVGVSSTGLVYAAANDPVQKSILLFKLRSDGAPAWGSPVRYQYAAYASTDTATGISVVPQNNLVAVYISGATSTDTVTTSGLLLKYTDSGAAVTTPTWVKTFTSANRDKYSTFRQASARAVAADMFGNVYMSGSDNRDDIGQGNDIWLMKYGAAGVPQWNSAKTYNSGPYSDDDVAGLSFDANGNVYVAGKVYSWSDGYYLWLGKYSSAGVQLINRAYDSGAGDDYSYDIVAGSASVYVSADLGGDSALYKMPLSEGAQTTYFTAVEGAAAGSVSLSWNYPVALPEGSTFYVRYSSAASPNWVTIPAVAVSTAAPQWENQYYTVDGLMTGRDANQGIYPQYKFRVWLSSAAGVYTSLSGIPASFARTPFAYDNTMPYGQAKLSYLSNISAGEYTGNAIAVNGGFVYQAFGNSSGDTVGLGFRKHNLDSSTVEWTKFFNTADGAYFSVNSLLRDSAGNFYAVGSRASEDTLAGRDLWLGKLSAAGDLVWSYAQDADGGHDEFYGAVLDGVGGLYVAGRFEDVTGEKGGEIVVRKYNVASASPYLVWASTQSSGYIAGFDAAYSVALDAVNERLYAVGAVTSATENTDLWAARFSLSGSLISSFTYNSGLGLGNAAGYGVAVSTSSVSIAGARSDALGNSTMYFAQYPLNLSPTPLWQVEEGPQGESAMYSVVVDTQGYIYGAGYESSWEQQGNNAIFGKLAPNGNMVWNRYFNDDTRNIDETAHSIVLDETGRVFSSIRTGTVGSYNPGFYMFPQPSFAMTAAEYQVPGSVSLTWLSQATLPAGTTFYVAYSTSAVSLSTASARESFIIGKPLWESGQMEYKVFGLDNGRSVLGAPIGADYCFKLWYSSAVATYTAVPGLPCAKASNANIALNTMVYSGDSKLFTAGIRYQYDDSLALNGIVRGPSGVIYSVVNAVQGEYKMFVLRKFSSGGQPLWSKFYSPAEFDEAEHMEYNDRIKANRLAADADGNVYVTGIESRWRGTNSDENFMFLARYNADGQLAWKYNGPLNTEGYGVAVDTSGYVYVAGSSGTWSTGEDAWLARFSVTGSSATMGWESFYDGAAAGVDVDKAYGVAVAGGIVYAAGSSTEEVDDPYIWIGRYYADTGVKASTRTLNNDSGEEALYSIAVVPSSGVLYAAGQTYNSDDNSYDGVVYVSSTDLSDFGVAVSTYHSASAMGGSAAAYGLVLDASGGVYVTGMEDRSDIGQGTDLWLRKYTAQLGSDSELWTQTFNFSQDDAGYGVALDGSGYVYAAGSFGDSDGLYVYKPLNDLSYKPILTAIVKLGSQGTTVTTPFAGANVAFIPYSQTGGIDASTVRTGVTDGSGIFSREMPSGSVYFIAISTQGYTPTMKDQQTDPNGTHFVVLAGDKEKTFTLYPASDPGSPLTVTVTSATAGDLLMAEVFFTETGEKVAYGMSQVAVGRSSVTFTVPNIATAAANLYTMGITIPARSIQRSTKFEEAFPTRSQYTVCMSTSYGAVISAAGFDVSGSTIPASFSGKVRNSLTNAPIGSVRVSLFHEGCVPEVKNPQYDKYETITDVNGRFSFYGVTLSTIPYRANLKRAGYSSAGAGWCEFYVSSGVMRNGIDISGTEATAYTDFALTEATFTFKGIITYDNIPVPNANVMVWGDYNWYEGGGDSYRENGGMGTDAKIRTGADGSFTFSSATANGLLEGGLRLGVEFMGTWRDLNEGKTSSNEVDADDIRIVVSGQRSTTTVSNCANGKIWMLNALTGACRAAVYPSVPLVFNIEPPSGEKNGTIYGNVVFVATYTISAQTPLRVSTASPVAIMATENSYGDYNNRSIGFVSLSGVYTVNTATYSISLATGTSYEVKLLSTDWGLTSSFDMDIDLASTDTARVNLTVGSAGRLTGNVLLPSGNSYKPNWDVPESDPAYHSVEVIARGQRVDVEQGTSPDENGEFEFPNLAPGTYDLKLRPRGAGFNWPPMVMEGVTVTAGKTTQVQLQLSEGLVVQPQLVGLPEQTTAAWLYQVIPVESGTEMNQKKITEMFFNYDNFAFSYSTAAGTWDKKYMLPGQYDFYLTLNSRYDPGGGDEGLASYDQFGNFIGKVKSVTIQRSETNPGLGSYAQPIAVSMPGAIGQGAFNGTLTGRKVFTGRDCLRIFSNFNELLPVIPAIMIYDAAGDLKGYTAAMPSEEDLPGFQSAIQAQDLEACKGYFTAHPARFMMPGLPPGNYTAVFNNPNYPPVAKELQLPYEDYAFDFDAQNILSGSLSGVVRSSVTLGPIANATLYLKHRTVEKFVTSGADGSFLFENLPAGIYRLEVLHDGFVKAGAKTSLSGSDTVSLDFYLTPSESSISGKIYMSKFPSPVTKAGVKIVAYDETMNVEAPSAYLPKIEANTDSSGEYELTGIIPGHLYKVAAFYTGKLTTAMWVTALDGVTYPDDIVLSDIRPQITVKVKKSPDSTSKVDVWIKSPKKLVTPPVCKFSPGQTFVPVEAVSLALVPGANYTYYTQFTVSGNQRYYTVYVLAGDTDKTEKTVVFDKNNEARTDQYIQDEAIRGGEVQMDTETEEYSGIELDPGALYYSTTTYSVPAGGGDLVGGFFSALPSVRTVKTDKGNLTIEAAVQALMASEVYDMDLSNASVNKPFTLTLKYNKEEGAGKNLKIYQYNAATGAWEEVPGNYTVDPMLGVVSVDVASLANASGGTGGVDTPLMRKRYGMSAVVNGRYAPADGTTTSQTGQFAVFTARPGTGISYVGSFDVYNLPNPFSLKNKTVSISPDGTTGGTFSSASYDTVGTIIKYHLPPGKSGGVKFVIYNLAGEKVRTIDDGSRDGGYVYYSEWDGKNDNGAKCASGVYFMLTYLEGKQLGNKAHKMALVK